MAKHAHPSSTDSALVTSTRSSHRRSLNVKTEVSSEQPSTDPCTPSTTVTDLSTDLHKSPASSRTSSNIIDTSSTYISPSQGTIMPPKAKASTGAGARSTATPDPTFETTESKPDRPGRNRKPTQKAAELAANRGSKLFKSGKERQQSKDIDEDRESSSNEVDPLSVGEPDVHEITATVSCERPWPASVKQQSVVNPVIGPNSNVRMARMTGGRKPAETSVPEITPIASKKRKHTAHPEDPEETSPKKAKTANTRTTRSKSKTPATEIAGTSPTSALTFKSTKSPRKHKPTEKTEVVEEAPPEKTKTTGTRNTRSKSRTPIIETISIVPTSDSIPETVKSTKKHKRNTALTEETAENDSISTEPQIDPPKPTKSIKKRKPNTRAKPDQTTEPTEPTKSPTKPTRLKFKPILPTTDSALRGDTGLPCALSCLENEQLFYMWAKIATEHEELADEVCAWPEFETDRSIEACLVRRRWNLVLAGFCACGRSRAVVEGVGDDGGGDSGGGKGGKES